MNGTLPDTVTGVVFDIKEFGVHDGPGLRTTVFLKGCPLRCVWCHNPEGLSPDVQLTWQTGRCTRCGLCQRGCTHADCQPYGRCLHVCPRNCLRLCGERVTARGLADRLLRNRALLQSGGVTFSGGEPLFQPVFLFRTAALLHGAGISVTLESCGYASEAVFRQALAAADFVFFDLKIADETAHRRYTGVSNRPILRNLALLRQSGVPFTLRTPLVPGITDTPENLSALAALVGQDRWEKLPFNTLAAAKYASLGMTFPYETIKQTGVEKE